MKRYVRANEANRVNFKRTIRVNGSFGNIDKFVFKKEYEGFGIYQEITPSGYPVSQEYLFTNGKITVISHSYTYNSISDIYDMIDSYNETGKIGQNAIVKYDDTYGGTVMIIHNSGTPV